MDELKSPQTWDETWLRAASGLANDRSKDPSTKVGAIIVSPDNVESFNGYNGFPMGFPDFAEWWHNRGENVDTEFTKYDLVIHAEMNAILKARCNVAGWTLYTTHMPCEHCAKHIIAAGISRVVMYQSETNMIINRTKVARMFQWGKVEVFVYAKPETS